MRTPAFDGFGLFTDFVSNYLYIKLLKCHINYSLFFLDGLFNEYSLVEVPGSVSSDMLLFTRVSRINKTSKVCPVTSSESDLSDIEGQRKIDVTIENTIKK